MVNRIILVTSLILILLILVGCSSVTENKNDVVTGEFISNITYKIIDYEYYNLTKNEKQIYESDYEDLLYGKKAILIIEYLVNGNYKDTNNDAYTIKIEYFNMTLELFDSNTAYSSNINNTLRLDYSYTNAKEIESERIELVVTSYVNSKIIIEYGETKLLNIVFEGNATIKNQLTLYTDYANNVKTIVNVINDTEYALPTPHLEGFSFEGWYFDYNYTKKASNPITINEDTILYAKWLMVTKIELDNMTCIFGRYPQTKETDITIIYSLNTKVGAVPSSNNKYSWNDYGYYIDGNIESYMYYIDIDLDGDGVNDYRGVYFTNYRPFRCNSESSIDLSFQDENGYNTNIIYWFKYEPILWDIVKIEDNKYTLVSRYLIDSQQYDYEHGKEEKGNSNYAESTIRKWLNETFYDVAFTDLEKEIIQTTLVDNNVASTGYNTNQYACCDTNDKVFLLSYVEANTYYTSDSDRIASGTDYAKSQGLYVSLDYKDKLGNNSSCWELRSPFYNFSYGNRGVDINGLICDYGYVYEPTGGIRVGIVINL